MLLYHVSEDVILKTWSIETLLKKVQHGFNFEMLKKGVVINDDDDDDEILSDEEIIDLYER